MEQGESSSIVYNVRLSSGRGLPPQKMQRCSDRDSDRERRTKRRGVNAALGVPRSSPLGLFSLSSALSRPSTAATTSSSAASRFPRTTVFFPLFCMRLARPSRDLSSTGSGTRRTEGDEGVERGGGEGGGPPVKRWKKEGTTERTKRAEGDRRR